MVIFVLTIIAAGFGVYRAGRKNEKTKQIADELKSVKIARKNENENSKLTTDQLIDHKL